MIQTSSFRKNRGVALIIVLLLLAMMVSIAAVMSERLFTQYKRASHQIMYQQAYWYSIAVEGLAESAIENSYQDDDDTVNMSQPWAVRGRKYPLDYGLVEGDIFDKQACFNLNVLAKAKAEPGSTERPYLLQVFQYLLESVSVENYQAELIADSTYDYIDSNQTVNTQNGVEDSYYESMSPAYVAPDGLLADATELRAVQGVSGQAMEKLLPLICTLPVTTWRLNINTISEKQANLLVAVFHPYLSKSSAVQLIQNRPFAGWSSLDDFLAENELSAVNETVLSNAKKYLGIDSTYFELDAQISVDDARVRIRSLLHSDDRENVTVIRRRFGGERERISARSSEQPATQ
ncbi:type II secretion system minor pseudopilin GspK [Vibrio quintilis]|uniref:Type II secretion system protein K n=1 Tax=Vibrio quintilis TaxID=1117707 RepID=A0A1M7Z0J2_9VIBR|nr:type II secretion system minor pseudopilin GspK [Vibrio quintilis]SHO58364.1 Putative type II secretion system protein K [Vibrio quintilis]